MRFIDDYKVILLDMMGTFMFGGDRFSDEEDYAGTYRGLGGHKLADSQVQFAISEVFNRMAKDYDDPACWEQFPPVSRYLESALEESHLPEGEVELLDEVFAIHETGKVPETHAEAIRQLNQTHRLGVVSNIWCKSHLCSNELRQAGVADCFERVIFSSDVGVIKPAPAIYQKAVEHFGEDKSKIVFVGDDLRCDVSGAKAIGLAAVWIDRKRNQNAVDAPRPDLVIEDIRTLLDS